MDVFVVTDGMSHHLPAPSQHGRHNNYLRHGDSLPDGRGRASQPLGCPARGWHAPQLAASDFFRFEEPGAGA